MRKSKINVTPLWHRQAGARVAVPVVEYQGAKLICDGNLPGDMARLIPAGWGNADAEAWRPFVDRAIVRGYL